MVSLVILHIMRILSSLVKLHLWSFRNAAPVKIYAIVFVWQKENRLIIKKLKSCAKPYIFCDLKNFWYFDLMIEWYNIIENSLTPFFSKHKGLNNIPYLYYLNVFLISDEHVTLLKKLCHNVPSDDPDSRVLEHQ